MLGNIKRIFLMFIVFILYFSNISANIIGTSKFNDNDKKNIDENSRDINLNASRSNIGLANSPWPIISHDQYHSGRSQYNTSNNNGWIKWNYSTIGSIFSSPIIDSDGTIYIGSKDGKFYALDSNGFKKWSFTADAGIESSAAIGLDGTIYFGTISGYLYALNHDGTEKWNHTISYRDALKSSLTVGSDGNIYCLSTDIIYVLYPNGNVKWTFKVTAFGATPAIGSDNTVYIGSNSGLTDFIYAISSSGKKKWEFVIGQDTDTSSPTIGSDGTIYIGCGNELYAINSNGTKKWDYLANGPIWSSPALDSDGNIYFGSGLHDNKLYALNPKGTLKWTFQAGYSIRTSPAIGSDGSIYFGADDGNLYALFPNGTKKWECTIGYGTTFEGTQSSPAIDSDGIIYIGSHDNKLYAIGTSNSSAPINLQAFGGNAQVELKWTIPKYNGTSAITNYTIYRGTKSGCETFLIKIGNILTYFDKNVTNGQKYYYEVTVSNSFAESPRSNEANATAHAVPSPPILSAKAGKLKVLLNWTVTNSNGALIMNYNIYRGMSSGTETLFINGYTGGTYWIDTNITVATKYYYMVSAVNASGEGMRSNEENAIPYSVPDAPGLNASAGNLNATISWTVPNSNGAMITNYSIYRGMTPRCETLLVKDYTGGTSWVDINVIVGTKYYYMVSANNIAGEGPKSNEKNMTAGASPGTPTKLKANGENAQVLLKWSAPKTGGKPDHYNIYRADSQTGTYKLISSPTTKEYRDKGLINGHNYWYKINAQNLYGVSGNTTAVSATPYTTRTINLGPYLLVLIIVIIITFIIIETKRKSKKKKT